MSILIRKAVLNNSEVIADCMMLAMEEIMYKFLGQRNYKLSRDILLHFVSKENNQYSYQNCWVAETGGNVAGTVNVYDGGKLKELRKPVIDYIKVHYNQDFAPEDETGPGEMYIDTLAVMPQFQGNGVATSLLLFLKNHYVIERNQILGLLVEKENLRAKSLYLKNGFTIVGEKQLAGKSMDHLQCIQ